jgi:hypothetical protein
LRGNSGAGFQPVSSVAASPAVAPAPRPIPKVPVAPQDTTVAPADLAVVAEISPVSADLATLWAQLVEAVGRVSPFTRSYLVDANPVSFVKNILVIGFDPEFEDHLGLVDNARNHTLLQTKLAELGHPNCQIKFIKAEVLVERVKTAALTPVATAIPQTVPAAAAPKQTTASSSAAEKKSVPVAFNKETFKNDPLIQKALEIFKGTIIEVRS